MGARMARRASPGKQDAMEHTAPRLPGFGLGFERMLMFVTGVSNIRDVIPFARTSGSAESSPEMRNRTRRNGLKTY